MDEDYSKLLARVLAMAPRYGEEQEVLEVLVKELPSAGVPLMACPLRSAETAYVEHIRQCSTCNDYRGWSIPLCNEGARLYGQREVARFEFHRVLFHGVPPLTTEYPLPTRWEDLR